MSNLIGLDRTSEPAQLPVTLTEMKQFLRIDGDDENELLSTFLETAVTSAEQFLRRSLITQTWKLTLDRFPELANGRYADFEGMIERPVSYVLNQAGEIYLPRGKANSVTSLVTYDDSNTTSTFSASNYTLNTATDRISLNSGQAWPGALRDRAAVEITYVAGYGLTSASVPQPIRTAIMMAAGKIYDERIDCGLPENCQALLRQYRIVDNLSSMG